MKSRQTRSHNRRSRRKVRISRRHQGGELSTSEPSAETNTISPDQLNEIKKGLHDASNQMIAEKGLKGTINHLEKIIKDNKKDNATNKIQNIAGNNEEESKEIVKQLIDLQIDLLAELKAKLNKNK